jgi:hypothetical protein
MLVFAFLGVKMLGLNSLFSLQVSDHFGLDMMYHSRCFHVMFCMCGDIDNCKH